MFKCGDGRCVGPDKICDGKFDCIDAADERDCGELGTMLMSGEIDILLFQIYANLLNGDVKEESVLLTTEDVMV